MAFFFFRDDIADELLEFRIARASSHLRMQIVIPDREEAGSNLAVRGDANTAAMAAKWMRYGRNDPDLSDAVFKSIPARRLRTTMRNLDERTVFSHPRENFFKPHHCRGRPEAIFFKRHELDESNRYPFLASEHAERDDLIFVEAPHQNTVHFERP